jgi:hypothetical protein
MQIREQGQQVQLIRSPYDKDKKRCVQKVFMKFERSHSYDANVNKYLSDNQIKELSADEIKTLSDWLTAKADKLAADVRKSSIFSAEYSISRLADAILSDNVDAAKASEIYAAMDVLAKALKKMGHERPKKLSAKRIDKLADKQASLLPDDGQ